MYFELELTSRFGQFLDRSARKDCLSQDSILLQNIENKASFNIAQRVELESCKGYEI